MWRSQFSVNVERPRKYGEVGRLMACDTKRDLSRADCQ